MNNSENFSCRVDSFVRRCKVKDPMRENAQLREQLKDCQSKLHQSDCNVIASQKHILMLKTHLEEARRDLFNAKNKIARLTAEVQMANLTPQQPSINTGACERTTQCTRGSQTKETNISELALQLQKAHEELEKWTAKLQSREDKTQHDQQQQQQQQQGKIQVLKNSIMDLSVNLQKEQVTLIKKAIKLSCNSKDQDQDQKIQSAQAEDIERLNLQIQKLQMQLLHQVLTLTPFEKEKATPTKYQWSRTHRDQEQQTEEPEQITHGPVSETQLQLTQLQQVLAEETAKHQEQKAVLLLEMQQLKEKLSAEETLRQKNETRNLELEIELRKKSVGFKEAEFRVSQLEEELLKTTEQWHMEHLKLNAEVAAAQKKAEEQLQLHLQQWQEEKASLQKATDTLQQTLAEKQQEWSDRETDMCSRITSLDSRLKEMLDKKSKKKNWLARVFKRSDCKTKPKL